jgi:NADH dehydrogenase
MKKNIVILGGGFGGVYTAMHLEKLLSKKKSDFEITIVNRENYFVYQPMLAEVLGGTVGMIDTVSCLRRLLPYTKLYVREIEKIDIENQNVVLLPQFSHKQTFLNYDHLVIALGNVTDFRGISGLHEHALPFKDLAHTLVIRNQVIEAIESAATDTNENRQKELLTFVVGGGGFSGVELVAELNDFVRKLIKDYPELDPKMVRVVLIHSKDRLMERELPQPLGEYAAKILKRRGVELFLNRRLVTATPQEAILDNGEKILCRTVISTVPSSPNPIIEACEALPKEHGKIVTTKTLQVKGLENVWAIGDCAAIPNYLGGICPPTAQFAVREAKVLAKNIVSTFRGGKKEEFKFKALGMLSALGHRKAVAEIFGVRFQGFFAWFLWRFIYWLKLPGFGRKIKVGISWFLDMLFPIDSVQLKIERQQVISQFHFEPGDIIFEQGDVGEFLYMIVSGEVEVIRNDNGNQRILGRLKDGEYFGEMALLSKSPRNATIRCIKPTDVLALKKGDFAALITNFDKLKEEFETTQEKRQKMI